MLDDITKLVSQLLCTASREERGQTYVEYALLVAFIAVVALAAVQLLGNSISSVFNSIAGAL